MAIRFLQTAQVGTLYNEGEVAGFDRKTEEDLVKRKIAERHTAKVEEPKP